VLIIDAAKRYRELYTELLFRRKLAEHNNTEVLEDEEIWFEEQLDECWNLMEECQRTIAGLLVTAILRDEVK
jgi:hypothetical protein